MNIDNIAFGQSYGILREALSARKAAPIEKTVEAFGNVFDRADTAVEGFSVGKVDTQQVVTALAEAEMALQTAVTVRDRLISAYQEVLRMPL